MMMESAAFIFCLFAQNQNKVVAIAGSKNAGCLDRISPKKTVLGGFKAITKLMGENFACPRKICQEH